MTSCEKPVDSFSHRQIEIGNHYYEVFEKNSCTFSVLHSPDCDCFIRLGYNLESFNDE